MLEVPAHLAELLPHRGIRRGTTVAVSGAATSLGLALVASTSASGSWVSVVGVPHLGLAAAEEMGVALERLLLVGPVPVDQWAATVAALVEAVDVVLVGPPPAAVPAGQARRVLARVRERGAVLVQIGWPERAWPDRPELTLQARPVAWSGIGAGHGYLQARQVEIVIGGRHGADRGRRGRFWLPDAHGRFAPLILEGISSTERRPPDATGTPAPGAPADRPRLSLISA